MWFFTCVPNFSSLTWIEVCQEPSILEVHTWRILMVPNWRPGGYGHSWHQGLSWYVILALYAKFQLSSMNWSVSRTFLPWCPYLEDVGGSLLEPWRMELFLTSWIAMICDMWLPWYVILDLCAKFQLSSMNRNVSRTPHPWSPYLEDVDGSWPETWRMGSFLTSLIILGDPQEVILKVSWRSDFIWLSYYSTNANIHMLRQKDPLFETHFHFG